MNERVQEPEAGFATVADHLPEHYIEAQTSLVERALRTLKHDETFAVLDSYGDFGTVPESPEGVFYRDTRHLSRFELRIGGKRPLLLGSVIQDDNGALTVDLTNPDLHHGEKTIMPRDIVALERTKFLWQAVCYERIGLRNYDANGRRFELELRFDADFRDLFEVRGMKREARGRSTPEVVAADTVEFRYEGLDGGIRRTRLTFEPAPTHLGPGRAVYDIALAPDERRSLIVAVVCEEDTRRAVTPFLAAYRETRRALKAASARVAKIRSSNHLFNEVIRRSVSDLYMLTTKTDHGPYPYAGVPWFSTVFGRDGIITAMMLLWNAPSVARGVLHHLAATQATERDPAADAQPGKILHERREGEMARLGEVPFRRYYGSVDSTPLFVMLAGRYYDRTGDRAALEALWPHVRAALRWCDKYGDRDGDGFVEYSRETQQGLANQGWKDSHDSVFHADGTDAEGPIALCEVQAYVYAAKRAGRRLARVMGEPELARKLGREAERLRQAFENTFWCEEIGSYALALDGSKRPCRVRTSNAGHALFAGIALPERARRVAETLMNETFFTGWGIRTLAWGEPRYNPMSYHNGSVWPHDNAMIAMGFGRYGLKAQAARVFEALFDAASYQELRRLPELFCGFARRQRRGPTAYPVACSPQAWAAAAPFALMSATLGLELDQERNEVRFDEPTLPAFLDEVVLSGLHLGSSSLDVRLHRHGCDAAVNVLKRLGDTRLLLTK
ncbi:MAG TPA: amylo-alpha-1,6-glucosidase [Microvirga sp.]|jgi:glycogen debranching enzyme|nr:amylo-alpha-1,6-glucosidase [Microvirga sp.]